jgi:hypothetical protein
MLSGEISGENIIAEDMAAWRGENINGGGANSWGEKRLSYRKREAAIMAWRMKEKAGVSGQRQAGGAAWRRREMKRLWRQHG